MAAPETDKQSKLSPLPRRPPTRQTLCTLDGAPRPSTPSASMPTSSRAPPWTSLLTGRRRAADGQWTSNCRRSPSAACSPVTFRARNSTAQLRRTGLVASSTRRRKPTRRCRAVTRPRRERSGWGCRRAARPRRTGPSWRTRQTLEAAIPSRGGAGDKEKSEKRIYPKKNFRAP